MSIEFVRRSGKAEISTKHLNLTDINGKTYGAHFPPHKTKFIVIDQERARCASFFTEGVMAQPHIHYRREVLPELH